MTAPEYAFGEDGPVYLTTAEVAARFRTSPSSVHDWRAKGEGPLGIRIGKRVLYPLPEVEEFERKRIEAARREQQRNRGINPATSSARQVTPLQPAARRKPTK